MVKIYFKILFDNILLNSNPPKRIMFNLYDVEKS